MNLFARLMIFHIAAFTLLYNAPVLAQQANPGPGETTNISGDVYNTAIGPGNQPLGSGIFETTIATDNQGVTLSGTTYTYCGLCLTRANNLFADTVLYNPKQQIYKTYESVQTKNTLNADGSSTVEKTTKTTNEYGAVQTVVENCVINAKGYKQSDTVTTTLNNGTVETKVQNSSTQSFGGTTVSLGTLSSTTGPSYQYQENIGGGMDAIVYTGNDGATSTMNTLTTVVQANVNGNPTTTTTIATTGTNFLGQQLPAMSIQTISLSSFTGVKFPGMVIFAPAPYSPDYPNLFIGSSESLWQNARTHINVFAFATNQMYTNNENPNKSTGQYIETTGVPNGFDLLVKINAFSQLKAWNISTALSGVPAVKPWDCAASRTAAMNAKNVTEVWQNGGSVQYVIMDEPLVSGVISWPDPAQDCHLTIDQTAQETAAFVKNTSAMIASSGYTPPAFIEREAYPSMTLQQHEAYIDALIQNGFHPFSYDLDIAIPQITDMNQFVLDLQALETFVKSRAIHFGVILWPSHGVETTDQQYYEDTMAFKNVIKSIVGWPYTVDYASWISRCPTGTCPATPQLVQPYIGYESIPENLPDSDPLQFSHTRLILNTLEDWPHTP